MAIRDRREAIDWAIRQAAEGDLILVAGKGHETTQEIQGVKHPFNDREAVGAALGSGGGNLMRLSDIAASTSGELMGADRHAAGVSIDTRTLKPDELYVAIKGARFDGNDFVDEAARTGASAAMVERTSDCAIPQILVEDGRIALGRLGAAWRSQWPGRLVGVTGSNGKTTVKEMVAAVLGVMAPVLKTQGNLNNDIGVPLTLLRLRSDHRYAVIEMGANHPGEIAYVANLARPDVAIIANAGAAHLEGFGSLQGVARAKGELVSALPDPGVAILNADDEFFGYWRDLAAGRRVVSFGFCETAEVRGDPAGIATRFQDGEFLTEFDIVLNGERHSMAMALAGRHNVANALAAIAVGVTMRLELPTIRAGLSRIAPVAGRLQPLRGRAGALLINDAYNANPSSFAVALDVLTGLSREPWVALGAFGELGEESAELHREIGRVARDQGIKRLFAVGPNADQSVVGFGNGAAYFETQQALIEQLGREITSDTALLIKGSRSQHMERVVEALQAGEAPCC
jgi:UDP-N-acetylmuramoyl-tripeptide--D-alanyl-D-alanine ligase